MVLQWAVRAIGAIHPVLHARSLRRAMNTGPCWVGLDWPRPLPTLTYHAHPRTRVRRCSINLYEYIKACNFKGTSLTVIRRVAQQVGGVCQPHMGGRDGRRGAGLPQGA